MNTQYPMLELTPDLADPLARRFLLAIRNPRTLRLRASKPAPGCGQKWGLDDGAVMYVWRMVAFSVSPDPKHHCMPVCADFDIKVRDWKERRAVTEGLQPVIDAIVDTVPKKEWHGIRRWGGALGYF